MLIKSKNPFIEVTNTCGGVLYFDVIQSGSLCKISDGNQTFEVEMDSAVRGINCPMKAIILNGYLYTGNFFSDMEIALGLSTYEDSKEDNFGFK